MALNCDCLCAYKNIHLPRPSTVDGPLIKSKKCVVFRFLGPRKSERPKVIIDTKKEID